MENLKDMCFQRLLLKSIGISTVIMLISGIVYRRYLLKYWNELPMTTILLMTWGYICSAVICYKVTIKMLEKRIRRAKQLELELAIKEQKLIQEYIQRKEEIGELL